MFLAIISQKSTQMKIVADRAIPFLADVLEPYAEVVYMDGDQISADAVRDADALIIRTRTRCNAQLLDGSEVKLIATATIGFDHIDLRYCRRAGIIVTTAAGCNSAGVLQWVAAALAMLARTDGFTPQERTLGIVGVGNVGRLVKEYAEAWGFRTICCDPPREKREHLGFVELEDVMREADIVTLHVPLDNKTRGMIGSEQIAMMREGATLINASRGEVVKTDALRSEHIRCILDVWEGEPDIDRKVLDKAMAATSHIAGYSRQGKANATAMSVRAVASFFGMPLIGWYPPQVTPSERKPIEWSEMCHTIESYCDLATETRRLKESPDRFEQLRNEYDYRNEYF